MSETAAQIYSAHADRVTEAGSDRFMLRPQFRSVPAALPLPMPIGDLTRAIVEVYDPMAIYDGELQIDRQTAYDRLEMPNQYLIVRLPEYPPASTTPPILQHLHEMCTVYCDPQTISERFELDWPHPEIAGAYVKRTFGFVRLDRILALIPRERSHYYIPCEEAEGE